MTAGRKNRLASSPFFKQILFTGALGILWVILAPALRGQDSRTVTEPSFPPSCAVLTANQAAGSLDERNFDTVRIQEAAGTLIIERGHRDRDDDDHDSDDRRGQEDDQ